VFTNLTLASFTFSPEITLIKLLTHPSICYSSYSIPLLCDCLSIRCAIWDTKYLQLWHVRVLVFSPNSFAFMKFKLYRPENTAVHNNLSACLIKSKTYLVGFIVFQTIMRSSNWLTNTWWIDLRSWIESIRISIFITSNMGFNFFPIHMRILSITLLEYTNLNI